MSVTTALARRYLFSKNRSWMVSLLAAIGVWGIAISVFAMILIQSVMVGFSEKLQQKLLRFYAPVILKPMTKELADGHLKPLLPPSLSASLLTPFLQTEVLLRTVDEQTEGIQMKGVELNDALFTGKLPIQWREGESLASMAAAEERLPGILLGEELIKDLKLFPTLEEEIELIYPFGDVDPTGELRPKTRRFRWVGTFKSGHYEYDHRFAIVLLGEARKLVPVREMSTQWSLALPDFFQAAAVADELSSTLKGSYEVISWEKLHQKRFEILQIQRLGMYVVLALMGLIASFNLFSLVMMMVVRRLKEIGILKAMGLSDAQVLKTFLKVGFSLGVVGAFLGATLTAAGFLYLSYFPISLPHQYYLDFLPFKIDPFFIALVILIAPFFTLLACYYPAKKGARLEIAEALSAE